VKNRASASSSLKKAVVLGFEGNISKGYLDPAVLGKSEALDLLTPEGSHESIRLSEVKSVCFVREFEESFEPPRKTFLSRPKLDGVWVRLRFTDSDSMEGIVANNLLELLDAGVQLTPPDLHGNIARIFIPRTSLSEIKVLGVVGVARRTARPLPESLPAQPRLFDE